ncbi:hypothetical protein FRC12_001436 [Ceratobasidium sp. 428]|nr:hypothetical protein FRC12_001436 [Ceratobasidium sp. 428]
MRPGPGGVGMMGQKPGQQMPPGMQQQHQRMMAAGGPHHPGAPGMQQRYPPGMVGGPPQHMMGPGPGGPQQPGMVGGMPNHMGGMPGQQQQQQQQQQMGQSPKDGGSRSNTPATAWSPNDPSAIGMQRRSAVAAQGGQMGPSGPGPQGRPQFMGPGGMGPGGVMGMGPGGVGQKRPGSPPPPQTNPNMGGSPPDAKRSRPNDPGPGTLADSRPDGRPTSSKGGMPFGAGGGGPGPQPMHAGPGAMNGQGGLHEYKQELSAMARQAIVHQGVQPPPFGKGVAAMGKPNGAGPGPGGQRQPVGAPSPASGEPRQVMNVKGVGVPGSMGPPASPSLANRNVGNVKKSESAGSSPALASSTVPNGMVGGSNDRSRTPQQQQQQIKQPPQSPRTRPQSAAPTMNPGQQQGQQQQGPQGPAIPPAPPNSAPPMMTQSPSNGMLPYGGRPGPGPGPGPGGPSLQDGPIAGGDFDFGPIIDFSQLTSEFLPDVEQMFDLNDWPGDAALGAD